MAAKSYALSLGNGTECCYTVRNSTRAKRLSITVSNEGVVEIVQPLSLSNEVAHSLILSKKKWLIKIFNKLPQKTVVGSNKLPKVLLLKMIDRQVAIEYINTSLEGPLTTKLINKDSHLIISGNAKKYPEQLAEVFSDYLKELGKIHLPPLLEKTSQKCGLDYNRVTIRLQKTRWGSCSSQSNISLNAKLLFFSKAVARSVCVHELCHTLEMNHSARFWAHVERFDPDYKQHRLALQQAVMYRGIPL